jgi:hypothetical protein
MMSDRYCIGCGSPYGKPHEPTCVRYVPPTYSQKQLDDAVAQVKHERELLGEGIAKIAQKLGAYDGQSPLTGPHLLLLLEEIENAVGQQVAQNNNHD